MPVRTRSFARMGARDGASALQPVSPSAQGGVRGAMDRFVSHYMLRLDAKGRVSIPAPFRAVLARDGFDGFTAIPPSTGRRIDAGGNALLAEIEALIGGFPPYSDAARAIFARALRHQRNAQDRRRGPCRPDRRPQIACGNHGDSCLRGSRLTSFRSGSLAAFARNSSRPPTKVRAFKQELGTRVAAPKPLGARE